MKHGILRNVSNASKGSTTSSDLSVVYSEPYTPPATPPRRPSHSSHRSDASDEMVTSPSLLAMRRQATAPNRVAWDLRQLAPPPPITDPAGNFDGAQARISPLLPDSSPKQADKKVMLLANNARFIGVVHGNAATGRGVIQYPNGDRYEGDVHDGYAHGYGILTNAMDGTEFRGRFEAGRQAQGVQTFEGGYIFDGTYQGNAAHGPGLLFDATGFLLRAPFVDGQPHGPGHVHYRSGDSFIGEFSYGRLAPSPSVVRYGDGRVALRLVRGNIASLEVVAQHADGVFMQQLLAQEQAISQEAWPALCDVRQRMQGMARRSDAIIFKAPQWSLLSWTPNEAQITALSKILGSVGDNLGATQKAMRNLVRCVLHLRGPARPYATSGDQEGITRYTPARTYADMQAFVADTVLPHYGTSKIILGAEAPGEEPLCLAYRLDGEQNFALRLCQAIDNIASALTAAYARDAAGDDALLPCSKAVLCSVLDGTLHFDAKLSRMCHTLGALSLGRVCVAPKVGITDAVAAPQCRPPVVVAAHERGCSYRRARTQFSGLAAPHAFRARARSSSLGGRAAVEEIGRLSPMIEVSDGGSPADSG